MWFFLVLHDGALEFGDARGGAASDKVSGDLGEEPLDHIEPGSQASAWSANGTIGAIPVAACRNAVRP